MKALLKPPLNQLSTISLLWITFGPTLGCGRWIVHLKTWKPRRPPELKAQNSLPLLHTMCIPKRKETELHILKNKIVLITWLVIPRHRLRLPRRRCLPGITLFWRDLILLCCTNKLKPLNCYKCSSSPRSIKPPLRTSSALPSMILSLQKHIYIYTSSWQIYLSTVIENNTIFCWV